MTKVLAHRLISVLVTILSSLSSKLAPLRYPTALGVLVFLSWHCQPAHGQVLLNGQVFTNGLAIVDSPAPNSIFNAASSLNVAIDVSGDGKLPQIASTTGFDSLTIYLVSVHTGINLTVSDDPGFLTQEAGSTVKHLNWPIPACLASGQYNLTLYELFHLQGSGFFGITSIPISIHNTAANVTCTSQNPIDEQTQVFSPPPANPWLNDIESLSTSSLDFQQTYVAVPSSLANAPSFIASPTTAAEPVTVTIGPSGVQWPLTVIPPEATETFIIQPASPSLSGIITVLSLTAPPSMTMAATGTGNSADGTVTIMVTPAAANTPVTVVFVSVETYTARSTAPDGSASVFTTVTTSFSTTTAVMGPLTSSDTNYAGFLPINALSTAISIVPRMTCLLSVLVVFVLTQHIV